MKRCPTCKRTFEDDTLSYCLDDGTPLVATTRPDSEETLMLPSSSDRGAGIPDTQPYNQPSGRSTLASDPRQSAMPQQYATPSPQRSAWPWLLAITAVLLLGFGVIVAVALVVPQLIHSKESKGVVPPPGWTPLPSPKPGRRWRYSNFVLTLAGEHATLRYHLDRIDGDTVNSYNYVDTFVWRDHRWQATSSHQVK